MKRGPDLYKSVNFAFLNEKDVYLRECELAFDVPVLYDRLPVVVNPSLSAQDVMHTACYLTEYVVVIVPGGNQGGKFIAHKYNLSKPIDQCN